MYPVNRTKQKLIQGEFVFGLSLAEMRSAALPHILAGCGYDFLFFDMEHSAEGFETICDLVWASRNAGITPIVRVPDPERFYVSRVLDAGAQGVIVPRIESVEQVEAVVDFSLYPPRGNRGAALGGRHVDFRPLGDPRAAMNQANNEILIGIQIETLPGLQRVRELAAFPGVDLLFIGPQDLSVALDVPNQWTCPEIDEAIRQVVAAAAERGVAVGIQGRNLDLSMRWMKEGVRMVVFGNTVMLLTDAARNGLHELSRCSKALHSRFSGSKASVEVFHVRADS